MKKCYGVDVSKQREALLKSDVAMEIYQPIIENVQKEFINQMMQGQTKDDAIKAAIQSIGKKYNSQNDEFVGEKQGPVDCFSLSRKFAMPSGTQIMDGLKFIAEIIPIVIQLLERIQSSFPAPVPQETPNI